jgi:ParB family chromosome partitioning protein
MAKRTKLTAPSAEDIAKLDADFRSENTPRPNPATAPIASVAAETALSVDGEPAQQKLNRLDAERLRAAEGQGRLILEIPTDQIRADAMIRDRAVIDAAELEELQISIRESGQRLPIEVYRAADGYTLLSGYRRLMAVRNLAEINPDAFTTINVLVRPPADAAEAFAAMVEENEIRANLSHFERGRIAVIGAKEGAFVNTEAAINVLFNAASAAKRSKVRSFAEIFECLGDLLTFPEFISERRGLRLANALRQNGERPLRAALGAGGFATAEDEWAVLEPVVEALLVDPIVTTKRGRPKAAPLPGWDGETLHLSSGISLRKERDSHGYMIRLSGKGISSELLDSAIAELQRLLEKPK